MTNPHCPARDIAHPAPGYSYRLKPAPRRPTAGRWGHKENDMIAIAVGIVVAVAVAVNMPSGPAPVAAQDDLFGEAQPAGASSELEQDRIYSDR